MKPLVTRAELLKIAMRMQKDPRFKSEYEARVAEIKELIKSNCDQMANQLAAVGFTALYLDADNDEYTPESLVVMDLTKVGLIGETDGD